MESLMLRLQSLMYPPRIEFGTLRLTEFPLTRGNQLDMFCSTVQGERILLKTWGLPELVFKSSLSAGETEAILMVNINQWFPDTQVLIDCRNSSEIGTKICNIRYKDDNDEGMITIRL